MLPSWLTQRGGESPTEAMHAVLGTPLRAPLMSDQEEAFFACGCFWGAEKGFWRLPGVVTTAVGYAGGERVNPSYPEVCSGTTGHTEVVRVVWSTPAVDFSDLLKLFWECHDPAQGNRQGNDTGTQYRSAIFFHSDEQKAEAERQVAALNASGEFSGPIVTEVRAAEHFWPAEDYHQDYYRLNSQQGYCQMVIRPKLEKLDLDH